MKSILLILDIDETLLFSTERRLEHAEDFQVGQYFVYTRPGLKSFLQFAQSEFDLAVWTTGTSSYAYSILQNIFPDPSVLKFAWSRGKCTQRLDPESRGYYWLKDLKKVKKLGYDLERILVVDDSQEKVQRNYGNHIPIIPFEGDPSDNELQLLQGYLSRLKDVDSVRSIEKRYWRASISTSGGPTSASS